MANGATPTHSSWNARVGWHRPWPALVAGDTVAIMAPNIPEMLEAHYARADAGAVLCPINIRLDAGAVAFILQHSEAKVVLVDGEFAEVMTRALAQSGRRDPVVNIDDRISRLS